MLRWAMRMVKRKVKAPTKLRKTPLRKVTDEGEKLPEVDDDDQAQPFVKSHIAISLY